MRLPTVAAAAALLLVSQPGTAAEWNVPIRVRPVNGGPSTTFMVSFAAPERTGLIGRIRLRNELIATGAQSARGCLAHVQVTAPASARGADVRLLVDPQRLGGRWCVGRYQGKVVTLQSAACPRNQACPTYVLVRATIGRFSLLIRPVPEGVDQTPPSFAGLARAIACTPGPQRPGEKTPYTLSWAPAHDDVTPTGQIVYEIYYATRAGGEDFSRPSWTSAPGAISFRTPGLPSHGVAYFVVRARDRAGNEDANTHERRGVDPCV